MKNINEKIEKLKAALNYYSTEIGQCDQRHNRALGCPMIRRMDSLLQTEFSPADLRQAFTLGLIGNNGHAGTIITNSFDITID